MLYHTHIFLNWDHYANGFGDINGEFWLGPSKLHRLTANTSHTNMLRVDLGGFDGNTAHAKYSTFRIGDSIFKYTLTVYGYTGIAGDSFNTYHNGRPFSTKDRDNDNHGSNHCAQTHTGGWWCNSCHSSNLNGRYYHSVPYASGGYANGIDWYHWKNRYYYSLKATEMKVRRV